MVGPKVLHPPPHSKWGIVKKKLVRVYVYTIAYTQIRDGGADLPPQWTADILHYCTQFCSKYICTLQWYESESKRNYLINNISSQWVLAGHWICQYKLRRPEVKPFQEKNQNAQFASKWFPAVQIWTPTWYRNMQKWGKVITNAQIAKKDS